MHARVPLLRVTDSVSGAMVDLSCCHHFGVANTALLKAYLALSPLVGQLCYFVKRWAHQRSVCGSHSGKLSSYAWVVLVIFYLQQEGVLPALQDPLLLPSAGDRWFLVRQDGDVFDCTFCADATIAKAHTPGARSGSSQSQTPGAVSNPTQSLQPMHLPYTSSAHHLTWRHMLVSAPRCLPLTDPGRVPTFRSLCQGFFAFFDRDFDYERNVCSVRTGRQLTKQTAEFASLYGDHFAIEDVSGRFE